jgi:hypothetical protein
MISRLALSLIPSPYFVLMIRPNDQAGLTVGQFQRVVLIIKIGFAMGLSLLTILITGLASIEASSNM